MELGLGKTLRDTASGYIGIAISKTEMLMGTTQYALQPQCVDNKFPDSQWIDAVQLEVVDDGISAKLPKVDDTVTLKLGEAVEDLATHFKGTIVEKITYMNGCVYFDVISEFKPKDKLEANNLHLTHKRWKRLGNGIAEKPTVKKVEAKPATTRPGGPSRPFIHQR